MLSFFFYTWSMANKKQYVKLSLRLSQIWDETVVPAFRKMRYGNETNAGVSVYGFTQNHEDGCSNCWKFEINPRNASYRWVVYTLHVHVNMIASWYWLSYKYNGVSLSDSTGIMQSASMQGSQDHKFYVWLGNFLLVLIAMFVKQDYWVVIWLSQLSWGSPDWVWLGCSNVIILPCLWRMYGVHILSC